MKKIIIVNNPKDWDFDINDVEVVSARKYLTSTDYAEMKNVRIFNLCRQYRYQSTGYYVSLLAEARGHKAIPSIMTILDFKSQTIVKVLTDEIDELIQKSLSKLKSDKFTLSIYFGKNISKQYDKLSKQLYNLFQAPLLRAEFKFNKKWHLQKIAPVQFKEIQEDHKPFIIEFAQDYFTKKRFQTQKQNSYLYDLAILSNPHESESPSNKQALDKFISIAEKKGFYVELITKEDYSRIAEFDALFIRETTAVNHHTYQFSRKANAEGLVVIDDPLSILRCTNKVYLAEILNKANLPTPKTLIIHKGNVEKIETELGLPCVLKKPDSSFSQGVVKAKTKEELNKYLDELLTSSDLIIGQEFLETDYDWRIGIIDSEPFYACKYHMAAGHWQIYNWTGEEDDQVGKVETMDIGAVPYKVLDIALKATKLIGDGLYGVDLKQKGDKVYLIEINDNPSIDAGYEDLVLGDKIYERILDSFLNRLNKRVKK